MFGSDEYADTGNVPVFRFDSGADAYEQVQFLTSVYENRYIFDNSGVTAWASTPTRSRRAR